MSHTQGFEREKKFHDLLSIALSDCPTFKAKTLKKIIAALNPEFMDGLFEPKPCVRKLKYLGCVCGEQPCPHGKSSVFEVGKVYKSIDFTGATYTIEGAGDSRIGYAHFELIE
jgi:hypothetical protein